MKVLSVYDGSAPKYHRILTPSFGLQLSGHDVKVVGDVNESDLMGIDIVFLNRMTTHTGIENIKRLRDIYGFKLVVDLDDHWILDKTHVLYNGYNRYNISDRIEEFIVAADAVTVTHDRLYEEVIKINPNCFILPNSIPKAAQFDIKKTESYLVRLFWAGGSTHRNDLELLKRPIELIKRDKVKLIIGGYDSTNQEWVSMVKSFTGGSKYNTTVLDILRPHEYYQYYKHCDISLIPLIDNEFNKHKSNLKILEAANIGSPVIVSNVHPYLGFPEHLVNYVDLHNTWFSQINKLVNDKSLREDQGKALQEYCDEHYNFYKISNERVQIFENISKAITLPLEYKSKAITLQT